MSRRVINIGKLNKRITFKKLTDVKDGLDQKVKKMKTLKTVWGSLYPLRGVEFYEIQKIQGKVIYRCYVRYTTGIDSKCYLECKGKTYSIESVLDVDEEHKLLEITCVEHIGKEVIKDVRSDSDNVN